MEKNSVNENIIIAVRGQKVILDLDLAEHYDVPVSRLKEQVKRNRVCFPKDHMFQLKTKEKNEISESYDHLSDLYDSKIRPYAFTQQGAIMVAKILNKMHIL